MSDVRVIGSLFSFVIDFQVQGYDTTSLFTTVTGTPAISSNLLRLTSASTRTKSQYLFGEYTFRLTVPVAPTAGQARSWGLKGIAVGDRGSVRFDVTDTVFSVLAYDNFGTLIGQETIPWDTDWTATATSYRIAWSESGVTFTVVGSTSAHVAQANIQFALKTVNVPNFIFITNGTADNLDCTFLSLNKVGAVESAAEAASGGGGSAGAGAYAEDTAHATGDLGPMVLAVRNDAGTALADTDLDYIPITTDSLGNEFVTQGTLIEGEDSTNRVMATSNKPTPVSTYAWSVDISAALEASSIVKATAGVLRSIDGRIDASAPTATYFLDVMNSATLPADGAVTELWSPKKIVHTTGTDSNFSIDFTMNGIYASAGIVVCLSSTEDTKTITAAYLRMSILYV